MPILRATIAVVDDDAGVRTALKQLLRSAGFDALVYGSAEEFLAGSGQSDVQCVIADINLPGMSGVALVQALAADGAPKCVLITGRDDPYTLELLSHAGGVPMLRKPFSDEALFEAISVDDGNS